MSRQLQLLVVLISMSCILLVFYVATIHFKTSVSHMVKEELNEPPQVIVKPCVDNAECPTVVQYKQDITSELVQIAKDVLKSRRYVRSGIANNLLLGAHRKIENLLTKLKIDLPVLEEEKESVFKPNPLVCPEEYKGSKAGYPFYQTNGWDLMPCNNVPPLNSVITVLLNYKNQKNFVEILTRVLKGLKEHYPSLHVFVATDVDIPSDVGVQSFNLTIRRFSSEGKPPGLVWNNMIAAAKTPYVLIGRDLERITWDIRLERQIRISNNLGVDVVGGAVRTPDGHWSIGCRQTSLKNYTLAYIEGYDMSRNSCLYCEHLNGPFVARTSSMRDIPYYRFDESLPKDVLFEDLFIRIRKNNKLTMGCPDALYFVEETESKKELKETWLPLVKKWQLNRVHLFNKKLHAYTCQEAETLCTPWQYKGMGLPICCMENLAKGMNKIFEVCEKTGAICESDTGNIMGSVKMYGILPWERDGDVVYLKRQHNDILNAKSLFTSVGYKLNPENGKYFGVGVPGWRIEMWGMASLTTEKDIENKINVTRVYTDGYWQMFPKNPGYFARARYGYEVFKHAQHWGTMGSSTSWITYKPGTFSPCPKQGHHACLDQFSGDGNLQFMGPWL